MPTRDGRIGVIGDSIALGTAWALGFSGGTRQEMQTDHVRSKVGASGNTIAAWPVPQTPVLVISMGSNATFDLTSMLAKVHEGAAPETPDAQIIFILPARAPERTVVGNFAREFGCSTVSFVAWPDGVHPKSYSTLAAEILAVTDTARPHVAGVGTAPQCKPLFDALRPTIFHGLLTQPQVDGIGRILDFAEQRRTPIHQLAYIGATATWETGRAMQPVEEAFNLPQPQRDRYLRSKSYYPYFGRGLVQVTWQANYAKFGVVDANDLLTWPVALRALFDGMEKGMFTGRKLSDYVSADGMRCDYESARRVVNGADKAGEIARMARTWFAGLHACGYGGEPQPVTTGAASSATAAHPAAVVPIKPAAPAPTVGQRLASLFFRRKDAA